MTLTHASGAAQSYGMRYLLKAIFNVAVGEEDNDGNDKREGQPTISEKQVADLNALITETKANRGRLLAYLKVTSLDQILAVNFDHVCREVRRVAANAEAKKAQP